MSRDDAFKAMGHRIPHRTAAHLDDIVERRPVPGDPLTDLVAAVTAPARPHELGGLEAALAAFASLTPYAMNGEPVHAPRASALAKVAITKVFVLGLGAAAAGGVAFAAVGGHLPTFLDAAPRPAVSLTDSQAAPVAGAVSGRAAADPASGRASRPSDPSSQSPSPSMLGLCRAWLAEAADPGARADSAAFQVLVRAAGGATEVDGYCTALVGQTSAGKSGSPHPASSKTHSNGKSSDRPTPSHSTGKPSTTHTSNPSKPRPTPSSTHPSVPAPSSSKHKGGKPSDKPTHKH
jgi:hypothetical protein